MDGISTNPINDFDAAVRHLSGGTNVAIYNDLGLPSIYVRRDKGTISQVIKGGPDITHYAFRVNGAEVPAFYMGKYLATVYKGRALSLPLQDPVASRLTNVSDRGDAGRDVTVDNAKIWCEANGPGFHLATIAEYAWIALLSRMNGTLPRGNNNYGVDFTSKYEKGIASTISSSGTINRTLTGSGPATWNDNWQPDGICDLNGNVYEWQGGYRTVDGELQIFPDNDAAMHTDQTETSTFWKAILQNGTLVEPGTEGSLKWDYVDGTPSNGTAQYKFRLNTRLENAVNNETASGGTTMELLSAAPDVSVPYLLKALALMPDGNGDYGNNSVYMRNVGERFALRGGHFGNTKLAGIFWANSSNNRSYYVSERLSFRPAFIPGI